MARYLIGMSGASGGVRRGFREACPGRSSSCSRLGAPSACNPNWAQASDLEPHVKKLYADADLAAPFASGSNRYDAFVIVPAALDAREDRHGIADTLITRAAAVALKDACG